MAVSCRSLRRSVLEQPVSGKILAHWGCKRVHRLGLQPVASSCKRPDTAEPCPFHTTWQGGPLELAASEITGAEGIGLATRDYAQAAPEKDPYRERGQRSTKLMRALRNRTSHRPIRL